MHRAALLAIALAPLSHALASVTYYINTIPIYDALQPCARDAVSTIVRGEQYGCGNDFQSYDCFCGTSSTGWRDLISQHVTASCPENMEITQASSAGELFNSYCGLKQADMAGATATATGTAAGATGTAVAPGAGVGSSGPLATATSAAASQDQGQSNDNRRTIAIAVGVTVPIVVLALILAGVILMLRRRKQQKAALAAAAAHAAEQRDMSTVSSNDATLVDVRYKSLNGDDVVSPQSPSLQKGMEVTQIQEAGGRPVYMCEADPDTARVELPTVDKSRKEGWPA